MSGGGDIEENGAANTEVSIHAKNYIASQYRIGSVTYGLILCLTGVVLTTIEPFKACKFWNSFWLFLSTALCRRLSI
jgi:hypothetical protein